MRVIIPSGGFATRYDSKTIKTLLKTDETTSIIERILKSLPEDVDPIIITNKVNHESLKDFGIELWCNGISKPEDSVGCLRDIHNCITELNIYDDLFIIVADIIYNFKIKRLIDYFNEVKGIAIPVSTLPLEEVCKAGCIDMKYGFVTYFEEHPIVPKTNISELGIYLIEKELLYLIKNCINELNGNSPGYLIEYAFNKKIPIYAQMIEGYWFHINTDEDYVNFREQTIKGGDNLIWG